MLQWKKKKYIKTIFCMFYSSPVSSLPMPIIIMAIIITHNHHSDINNIAWLHWRVLWRPPRLSLLDTHLKFYANKNCKTKLNNQRNVYSQIQMIWPKKLKQNNINWITPHTKIRVSDKTELSKLLRIQQLWLNTNVNAFSYNASNTATTITI